jgi:diguanylate cyclase (GGDEF)-like protein
MKRIREAVLNCIYHYGADDEKLINELQILMAKDEERAYSILFNVLTHLELEPDVAQHCWNSILEHRKNLIKQLNRDINLRTVICDYFCSVDKTLKNPVVVEIHVFEDKLNSMKYDALTGLISRNTFEEALSRELARSKRYETELSLLFFDVDDFKNINDTFGHLAGDQVLKDVGKMVKGEIRAEDSAARYGGDEIVIILPETGKIDALVLGERVRKKVESLNIEFENKHIQPTVSGGLASYPIDAQNITDLIRYADNALYRAKEFGKNNIAVYSFNKRRYLRINFFKKIHIRKIGFNEELYPVEAISKNISVAGILFESDIFLEIGTKIELKIPMPNGARSFIVVGTIVRVEFFDSTHYDIGVSFLELDMTAKHEISKFLIRQLEHEKD